MADGRLHGLLPKLIERTQAGKVSWTPVPTEGENTFVHVLPEGAGSLLVRRLYSGYQLTLRNANDAQLESLGEMQEVRDVATLWNLIYARGQQPADAYSALENDLA
jgi:hypothetical protein